jgi:uncharacterized protein YcnI
VSALAIALLAVPASAHVTIMPRQSTAGIGEKYTVRVPTEGKVPTISAELGVADGVTVYNVQAPVGWKHEIKRKDDRVVGIAWTVDIQPGEYMEFSFIALNPRDKSELVWTLRQTYTDGRTDDWTHGPDGLMSGAVTKLSPRADR